MKRTMCCRLKSRRTTSYLRIVCATRRITDAGTCRKFYKTDIIPPRWCRKTVMTGSSRANKNANWSPILCSTIENERLNDLRPDARIIRRRIKSELYTVVSVCLLVTRNVARRSSDRPCSSDRTSSSPLYRIINLRSAYSRRIFNFRTLVFDDDQLTV